MKEITGFSLTPNHRDILSRWHRQAEGQLSKSRLIEMAIEELSRHKVVHRGIFKWCFESPEERAKQKFTRG